MNPSDGPICHRRSCDCIKPDTQTRRGKRLGKDDILISWKKPAGRAVAWSTQEFAALPDTLTLAPDPCSPLLRASRLGSGLRVLSFRRSQLII